MKRAAQYIALFITAFGIAGTAGYIGVMAFTRSAPEVILPDLVGKNIIDVLETLTHMGLNPKLHRTQFHASIPKYGVCFQDPEPGATIKKGRDVVLYISKGFKEIQMPDLRQIPLKEGLLKLEAREIKAGKILYVHASGTLEGAVIAQHPLPGTRVAAGSQCRILVSKGSAPVDWVMPDLKGLDLNAAVRRLTPLNLDVGNIRSDREPNAAIGEILKQTPPAGSRVSQSAQVQLVVNRPRAGQVMDARDLNRAVFFTHTVPEGFANRYVRVIADVFGMEAPLIDGYMKPGKMINLLIPGGIRFKIRIFIDQELVRTQTIDPWSRSPEPLWENWHWHLDTIGDFLWKS